MKTEVTMKRNLFGVEIRQKSKTEMFSGTDLVNAGNKWRRANELKDFNMAVWLKGVSTTEFIEELEKKYKEKAVIKGRGRNGGTWLHPLLFIDMALAISPKLKIETYEWLFDRLIKSRNDSGSSYKLMCGSLFVRHGDKKEFVKYISSVANSIKLKCKVEDWQEASEVQLAKRDNIHKDIAWLADSLNNNEEAVRMALLR